MGLDLGPGARPVRASPPSCSALGGQQLRAAAPLVDLRLLRHPAVLTGDVCATVLGVAMYMYLSVVTEFVQTPSGDRLRLRRLGRRRRAVPRAVLDLQPLGQPGAALAAPASSAPRGAAAGLARRRRRRRLLRPLPRPPVAGLRDDGHPRHRLGLHLRRDPRAHRPRRPRTGRRAARWASTRWSATSASRWAARSAASILASQTAPGQTLPSVGGYTLGLWVAARDLRRRGGARLVAAGGERDGSAARPRARRGGRRARRGGARRAHARVEAAGCARLTPTRGRRRGASPASDAASRRACASARMSTHAGIAASSVTPSTHQ